MPLEKRDLDDMSTQKGQMDLFLYSHAERCSDILCGKHLASLGYRYEDFFIQASIMGGMQTNTQMFLDVPLQTARMFYIEFIRRSYKEGSGWWAPQDGMIPTCDTCNKKIGNYKDLRRFFGRSTHGGDCAKTHLLEMSFGEENLQRKYFERVASL